MSKLMSTILIIGGTSGIGEAFAKRFHSMGKNVIITGRRKNRLAELEKALPGSKTYAMDITDLASIPTDIESLFSRYPEIDNVWINAGILTAFDIRDVSSTTDASIINEITSNVTGPMLLARYVIPKLLSRKTESTLMMTSSRLGFIPLGAKWPVYCPTKAAIHSFMVGLRQSLKGTNVNVIEIVPPLVATEFVSEHGDRSSKAPKPMPLDEFTDAIFNVLDNNEGKNLKEVGAGGGVAAIDAWRGSLGKMMESQGIGD